MSTSYLGGIWGRGPRERRGNPPPTDVVQEDWGWVGERNELFLRGDPASSRLFSWDSLAILVRGYARSRGTSGPVDVERVAEELRCHYLEQGTLAVDDLEGSFTLALLDGHAGRVILYRNLVGSGFTYYHNAPGGLLFAGNLVELVRAAGAPPRPNRAALPGFFLFRCVPGPETLFADCYRLLPGEQLTWEAGRLVRRQRHGFNDLAGSHVVEPGRAVEELERTLAAVLADCATHRPGAANLLSGGVDSSYIQAVWNQVGVRHATPTSYSVSVDHPRSWADTDYALTAGTALGTRHVLTPADGPYADYLLDTLAGTGEPLNHVQSAYFGHLARTMAADDVPAGLCGEGADSLFGLGMANQVHNASAARWLLPVRALRRVGGWLAAGAGMPRLASTLRLADAPRDWADLAHPVNRVAAFTDWERAEACFGRRALEAGAASRRELLDRFGVPHDPMHRLHAMGFLGEAMDSAGLWATLFNRAGTDLLCPFLDSRVLRFALSLPPSVRYPFRRPKELLKRALCRHVPESMARRAKLGFGQPVFEWLAPGGQLRPLVEQIDDHDFLDPAVLAAARERPGWFLYNVLCYDLWHKLFITESLPLRRPVAGPALLAPAGSRGHGVRR